MRCAFAFVLLLTACGESTMKPGLGPCAFGSAVALLTPSPEPTVGDFSYSGPATQTDAAPFTLAFEDRFLVFDGFAAPPTSAGPLTLAYTIHCTSYCDLTAVVTDTSGLVVGAWDTTSMDSVVIPGFTLTYADDGCVSFTGDPVVPQIGSITLTATSGADTVSIAAGERVTLGGAVITNGQSTVNSHRVTYDLPDRLFRGSIVRQ